MGGQQWMPAFDVFLFLILLYLLASAKAQTSISVCNHNSINYTSNSIYDANLNSLLPTLSHNVDDNCFYNASVGQNSDRANAIVLCRGDIQLDRCRSCVQEATTELLRKCPNKKQGVIFYEFCLLRFSNESIFGTFVSSPMFFLYNTQNATSPDQFVRDRGVLIRNLSVVASGGGSRRKVAFGVRDTSDSQAIYAIVQCSPDLFPDDCNSCLNELDRTQMDYCGRSIGCRALGPSCNFRYETQPFYNETRLQELLETSPKAMPPPLPPQGKISGDNSSRTIIIILASVSACLVIVVCVGILFLIISRIRKKPMEMEALETRDMSAAESLQYDFNEIKAATDDFSATNKLGKDEFGIVYRGKLSDGQEIAVKKLATDSGKTELEFKKEVVSVIKLHQMNLVRFLGFSIEGTEKLLVYEFVKYVRLDQ